MKKKRLVYDEWTSITSKRFKYINMENKFFKGIGAILYIDEVTEPQSWEFNGEEIIVGDYGMKWLQLIPYNDTYAITAMINRKNEIELWYIDMIVDYGIESDNIPYFHDLYLDLVIYKDGTIKVDDMDELLEAFNQKKITLELYNQALETSARLQNGILTDVSKLNDLCRNCLKEIEEN